MTDQPSDSSISNQELLDEITRLHDRIDTLESKLSESEQSGAQKSLEEKVWQDGQPATTELVQVVNRADERGRVTTSEVADIVGVTNKPAKNRMKILADKIDRLKFVGSRPRNKPNLLVSDRYELRLSDPLQNFFLFVITLL